VSIFNPLKILLHPPQDFNGFSLAELIDKPLLSIAILFGVIATSHARFPGMTQGDNIPCRCSRVIEARVVKGYPMIHCDHMPKITRSATYRASMVEVFETLLPIKFRQIVWEVSFSCLIVLTVCLVQNSRFHKMAALTVFHFLPISRAILGVVLFYLIRIFVIISTLRLFFAVWIHTAIVPLCLSLLLCGSRITLAASRAKQLWVIGSTLISILVCTSLAKICTSVFTDKTLKAFTALAIPILFKPGGKPVNLNFSSPFVPVSLFEATNLIAFLAIRCFAAIRKFNQRFNHVALRALLKPAPEKFCFDCVLKPVNLQRINPLISIAIRKLSNLEASRAAWLASVFGRQLSRECVDWLFFAAFGTAFQGNCVIITHDDRSSKRLSTSPDVERIAAFSYLLYTIISRFERKWAYL